MIITFLFILGLLLGSFANVCIYRIPCSQSIVFPPSNCPFCNARIKWYDNIPILSFLILCGRCRTCSHKISLQYPLVELTTAILISLLGLKFSHEPSLLILYVPLTLLLVILSAIDFYHQIIPDGINLMILILGIAYSFFNPILGKLPWERFLFSIVGSLSALLIFMAIAYLGSKLFKKDALGGGDIKLIAGIGAIFGLQKTLLVIFTASLIGSIIGLFLILFGFKKQNEYIPFGPFLAFGAYLTIFIPETFSLW